MRNFNQDQSLTLILDGYNDAESIIYLKLDDVRKWDNNKDNLKVGEAMGVIGSSASKAFFRISGLSMHRNPIVLAGFDQQDPNFSTNIARIHSYEQDSRGKNDSSSKFEVNKWSKREEKMVD